MRRGLPLLLLLACLAAPARAQTPTPAPPPARIPLSAMWAPGATSRQVEARWAQPAGAETTCFHFERPDGPDEPLGCVTSGAGRRAETLPPPPFDINLLPQVDDTIVVQVWGRGGRRLAVGRSAPLQPRTYLPVLRGRPRVALYLPYLPRSTR